MTDERTQTPAETPQNPPESTQNSSPESQPESRNAEVDSGNDGLRSWLESRFGAIDAKFGELTDLWNSRQAESTSESPNQETDDSPSGDSAPVLEVEDHPQPTPAELKIKRRRVHLFRLG